ncbi:MAG: AAA family ATPase, partial [Candidatus Micrarchaeota archaeon]
MTLFLGVTGTLCSGKGSFAKTIYKKFGALSLSTSDEVRAETAERGLSLERENLHKVANECRAGRGADLFAVRCVNRIRQLPSLPSVVIVNDLRSLGEVDALREAFGKDFYLVGVGASQATRFNRVQSRRRAGEGERSFAEWKALDDKECRGGGVGVQSVAACLAQADLVLFNDSTFEAFERASVSLVSSLLRKQEVSAAEGVAVVGFAGFNAAGKTTACRLCQEEFGALCFSLSDEIRREVLARGGELSTRNLIDVGNELRGKLGLGVLAERVAGRIKRLGTGSYCIDALFNPAEADALRKALPGFKLVFVGAPLEVRYARFASRRREGDGLSLEEFRTMDAGQKSGGSAGQRIDDCRAAADVVVENAGSEEEFAARCRSL